MALKHMFEHIEQEAHKDVEEQVNSTKVTIAKQLIALGEDLEKQYQQKNESLSSQLKRKEELLKSEQNFQSRAQMQKIEHDIANELLLEVENALIEFPNTHSKEYNKILSSWILKVLHTMEQQSLTIHVVERDINTIDKVLSNTDWEYTINVEPKVKAGFIVMGATGETVDLSFDVLFRERKEYLLQLAMNELKESL